MLNGVRSKINQNEGNAKIIQELRKRKVQDRKQRSINVQFSRLLGILVTFSGQDEQRHFVRLFRCDFIYDESLISKPQ